ncbi:MAG: hypothetical protein ABIH23_06630 [bacterium]
MTVRQVFYRLVSEGVIDKAEREYKGVVMRSLKVMRLDKTIPFGWIADNTRWMRKPDTYSSAEQMLREAARFYRRSLWDNQSVYVEVWCEKDALAGVLYEVTEEYDVPLMVNRGFGSLTFLYEAAQSITHEKKPAYIYYFGDHDPSGKDIVRDTEAKLRMFAPDADIHFECVAVTPEQIKALDLPTRPTKRTDTRSKGFKSESVELDAIPSKILRHLVRSRIEQHIDPYALDVMKVAEDSERNALIELAGSWRAA